MNEKIVRLINILQDRFTIPEKTDGANVIMTFSNIEAAVNDLWKASEGDWTGDDLMQALDNVGVPSFINFYNTQVFLLVRS